MDWQTLTYNGPFAVQMPSTPRLGGNFAAGPTAPVAENAVEFAERRLGFTPDAKQAEVLLSSSQLGILNCSRQWGKSTVAAAKAVHLAYTKPGSLVLIASPTERQSGESMEKVKPMVSRLGIRLRGDGHNPISLVFPNGSRIVGLPGTADTARGLSKVALLIVDEASRVDDQLVPTMLPMLTVANGSLWLLSTPYGRRGMFYRMWERGGAEWHKVRGTALECPRIPRHLLEAQRGMMTRQLFEQEYLCEFVDNGSEVFGRQVVENAVDASVRPLEL